jgi:hypothetical protein
MEFVGLRMILLRRYDSFATLSRLPSTLAYHMSLAMQQHFSSTSPSTFHHFLRHRGTYCVDGVTGAALESPEAEAASGVDRHNELGDGAVRFRHDPRLVLPTRVYLTNAQVSIFSYVVYFRYVLGWNVERLVWCVGFRESSSSSFEVSTCL